MSSIPAGFWFVTFIISLPHLLYAYIWTQSSSFRRLVAKYVGTKADPVQVMAKIAYALKLIQFTTVFIWYYTLGDMVSLKTLSPVLALIGVALFAVGQILNAAVYKALGVDGVYYGTRLGKKIPWVKGFPFGIVPHPQYFGSVLTIWAAVCFLYAGPQHVPFLILACLWTGMYVVTAIIEDRL